MGWLRRLRAVFSPPPPEPPSVARDVGTNVRRIDAADLEKEGSLTALLRRSSSPGTRIRWEAVWVPLAASGHARSERLWVRRGEDGLLKAFPGRANGPTQGAAPIFYLNGPLAYRDEGHPDGPSSIPYYVISHRGVRPAEGHPGGADEHLRWRITIPPDLGRR
jgi:hypothetical protein